MLFRQRRNQCVSHPLDRTSNRTEDPSFQWRWVMDVKIPRVSLTKSGRAVICILNKSGPWTNYKFLIQPRGGTAWCHRQPCAACERRHNAFDVGGWRVPSLSVGLTRGCGGILMFCQKAGSVLRKQFLGKHGTLGGLPLPSQARVCHAAILDWASILAWGVAQAGRAKWTFLLDSNV